MEVFFFRHSSLLGLARALLASWNASLPGNTVACPPVVAGRSLLMGRSGVRSGKPISSLSASL